MTTKVITLDEAEEAFRKWAETVWEGCKAPIIIHKEDARQAADAFFGQLQINRGEQPSLKRTK